MRRCKGCGGEFMPRGGSQWYCAKECSRANVTGANHHMKKAMEAGESIRSDLAGQTFGRWTVLEFSHRDGVSMYWNCRCRCGAEKPVRAQSLRGGRSKSCGCLQKEEFTIRATTHGHSRTRIYASWRMMVKRCHDPKAEEYHRYGARGIRVCDRWRESFDNFLADMGERPSPEMTVDRIDNDGPYAPGNCRWATPLEQGQNRRNSQLVTHEGRTLTISAWCRETGLQFSTLKYRIRSGWPVDVALSTPGRDSN